MGHPTEGVLRRLLDEPGGVAEDDRSHVAACARCAATIDQMRADVALVGASLATDVDVDVDSAWSRLTNVVAAGATSPTVRAPRPDRARWLLRRPAAVAIGVVVVLTGASAAAANDWFEAFRTERVVPIEISADDLTALPDLRGFGAVELLSEPEVRPVADAAAAARASGMSVPIVDVLPRGVRDDPRYRVGDEVRATFSFSTARAARTAEAAGSTLPTPPPGLDGSEIQLVAGPGVLVVWPSGSGAPALVVGRATAPQAFSSAVPFDDVRDYLLSLPGMPDDVAAQLGAFDADAATLPLPIPDGEVEGSPTTVDGAPATLLTGDGTVSAVVWVRDGVLSVVAGSIGADEVLAVARGLR